jgi:hypothetical protein
MEDHWPIAAAIERLNWGGSSDDERSRRPNTISEANQQQNGDAGLP